MIIHSNHVEQIGMILFSSSNGRWTPSISQCMILVIGATQLVGEGTKRIKGMIQTYPYYHIILMVNLT